MSTVKVFRDLEQIKLEADAAVTAFNTALDENDAAGMRDAEESIDALVKEYAGTKRQQVFVALRATDDPIKSAVLMYEYEILRVNKNRSEGTLTSYELGTTNKHIDLKKLCDFCKLPVTWDLRVQKLSMLLAVRTANEIGYTKERLEKLVDGWFLKGIEKSKEDGKTPTSNTQCVKMLQSVIDLLLPDQGYKATNHDIGFLLSSFVDVDKRERHTLVAKKPGNMNDLVLNVLNKIVTGGTYKVMQKLSKKQVEAAEEAAAKAEEAKPKKSAPKAKKPEEESREVPAPKAEPAQEEPKAE